MLDGRYTYSGWCNISREINQTLPRLFCKAKAQA